MAKKPTITAMTTIGGAKAMATIERRPRQFLAVWSDDGKSIKGATIEESLFVEEQFIRNEVVPIADTTPAGFADVASLFSKDVVAQCEALEKDKTDLTKDKDKLTADLDAEKKARAEQVAALTTTHTNTIDELTANNAQVVQALKDAHQAELDAKIAELDAIKESLKPKPVAPGTGPTKTISLTIPSDSWALIQQALFDESKDVPAEQQAIDFVLSTVAGKYAAYAKSTALKPTEKLVENAKKQVDKVVGDRIVEVLAATSVVVE